MSIKLDIAKPEMLKPKIAIFGVGGAGGNALNNMIIAKLEGVEFIAANTDSQALTHSLASIENRIQLGVGTTAGLGAGSFPDKGKAAAEENLEEIIKYLNGCHMVFIAAGMGGGTGTGAAPVIAKLAKEREILTVGVITKPFHFEGKYRMQIAEQGIEELKKHVDTLIIIPNQNLFRIANESTTFEAAFKMADDVLHAGVRGITDLITMPGLVNLDFADIRTIMTKMGKAMMGTGEASGENRAIKACEIAISNPLLDDISIKGAKGVLVNMTGGPDMTLFEADIAVNTIRKEVDSNANIIFGTAFNENMKGKIRISVVATGIDQEEIKKENNKNESKSFRFSAPVSNKSFFDPGIPSKLKQQEITEITDKNFQIKKSISENSVKQNPLPQQNLEPDYFDENLAENSEKQYLTSDPSTENDADFFIDTTVVPHKKQPQTTKNNTYSENVEQAIIKKETSGFSLFSFMNTKEKTNNIQNDKTLKNQETELEKKKQQFFGTIFEEDNQEDDKINDDIINIPAFFRRKK
jgi:cell division protein FtsZ